MSAREKSYKFPLIVLGTLIIMFGFGYLPTFGQITPDGMRVLGIFIGCIFAWCWGELVWSSIIGLLALVVYNYGSMNEVFASAFGNSVLATFITAVVFCFAIEKSGLLAELAQYIISRKWAQKNPWMLVFAFFLTATVLGALSANVMAPLVLLWALFYEIARDIGLKPYSPLVTIVLCGIGVTAYIGTAVVPYAPMTVLVRGAAETVDPNFVFDIGSYMLLNLLSAVIYLPLLVLVLRLIFGRKINFVIPQRESYKMNLNLESKIALVVLLLIVIGLVVPNFLPEGNIIRTFFVNKLTIVGAFMLGSAILMIIRVKGKPVLDVPAAIANIPWALLLLIAAALAISDYIVADGMGVVPTIVSFLNPLVEGHSAFAITMIFIAIGLIMTNFINDVVTCMVLYPIAAEFIIGAGGSEMLLAILFAQVTIQGCLMPSGSIVGAMFHGNSEWMKPKDVFLFVAIMEALLLLVLCLTAAVGSSVVGI